MLERSSNLRGVPLTFQALAAKEGHVPGLEERFSELLKGMLSNGTTADSTKEPVKLNRVSAEEKSEEEPIQLKYEEAPVERAPAEESSSELENSFAEDEASAELAQDSGEKPQAQNQPSSAEVQAAASTVKQTNVAETTAPAESTSSEVVVTDHGQEQSQPAFSNLMNLSSEQAGGETEIKQLNVAPQAAAETPKNSGEKPQNIVAQEVANPQPAAVATQAAASPVVSEATPKVQAGRPTGSEDQQLPQVATEQPTAEVTQPLAPLPNQTVPVATAKQEAKAPQIASPFIANEKSSFVAQTIQRELGVIRVEQQGRGEQGLALGHLASDKRPVGNKHSGAASKLAQPQQEKLIARINEILDNAVKGKTGNTLIVKLEPADLGKLTVRVTQRADQVYARVVPESEAVEAAVRSHLPELIQALANAGLKSDNIHIQIGAETSEQNLLNWMNEERPQSELGRSFAQGEQNVEEFEDNTGEEDSELPGWVA